MDMYWQKLEELQWLFVHVMFIVMRADVLGTRPYLGPFQVLELNCSLCKPYRPYACSPNSEFQWLFWIFFGVIYSFVETLQLFWVFISINFQRLYYHIYSSLKNSICRICVLFVLAYTGHLYPCNHKRLFIWLIVSYGLTSWFSGYKAASFRSSFTPLGLVIIIINVYSI